MNKSYFSPFPKNNSYLHRYQLGTTIALPTKHPALAYIPTTQPDSSLFFDNFKHGFIYVILMYLHTSWLNNGGSYKTDSLSHIYCFQCALTKLRCIAETLLFVIILLSCNYPSHTWMHSSCLTSVCLSAPRLFISRYLMNFLQSRLWNTYLIQSETLKLSATAALDRLSSQFVFLSCYLMLCL